MSINLTNMKTLSPETLQRIEDSTLFDADLVIRFHAAFQEGNYSQALQLMDIRDRLESRSALAPSYF